MSSSYDDPADPEIVKQAKKERVAVESQYDERDVALYNLGIGANEKDLEYIYEGDDAFEAIPTFGVLPMIDAMHQFPLDFLPNFEPAKLLHGEQSLRILGPIPTRGKLVSNAQLIECLDKGKAVSVVLKTTTKTSAANPGGEKVLFENVSTLFIRGSGGFGGQRHSTRSDESTATNRPPARKPDAIMFHTTSANQAALYRLSGDYNPLHVDPEFAEMGGFSKPILHGLCSYGISARLLQREFGKITHIKARFAGTVLPGERLTVKAWKMDAKHVIFESYVDDRVVLSAAAVNLA